MSDGKSRDYYIAVATLLALVGLFVLSRPYTGIRHDGVLYLGQAFFRLNPEIFANDIFFRFGSQEQFSLFGRVYALVIAWLGVETASISLTLLSQAVFLTALVAMARRITDKGLWPWAVLFFVISSGVYGGLQVFRVAEPFVTSRPFAEALVLLAVMFLFTERRWVAAACLVAAGLLHPLQSLAGWLLWWVWQVQGDRRWLGAMVLGAIPVGLGLAGIAPFDRLFQTFDSTWLALIEDDNKHVFMSRWHWQDALVVFTDVAIMALARRVVAAPAKRLLDATLIVTGIGLVLSFVLGDIFGNVLGTGLQLWRVLWVAQVVAILMVPVLVKEYWNKGNLGHLAAALLLFAVILRGLPSAATAMVLAILVTGFLKRWQIGRGVMLAAIGALAATAVLQWLYGVAILVTVADHRYQLAIPDLIRRIITHPLPLLGLGALALSGLTHRRFQIPSLMLAVVVLGFSATTWDQRSPWSHVMEHTPAGQHPFAKFVDKDAEVLWYEEAIAPWLLLQRQSYVSGSQAAGQMFNRETAMEIERRVRAIAIFGLQKEICEMMNNLNQQPDSCIPDTEAVREVCKTATDLDFIVVPGVLNVPAEAHWRLDPAGSRWHEDIYLYRCERFRKG